MSGGLLVSCSPSYPIFDVISGRHLELRCEDTQTILIVTVDELYEAFKEKLINDDVFEASRTRYY